MLQHAGHRDGFLPRPYPLRADITATLALATAATSLYNTAAAAALAHATAASSTASATARTTGDAAVAPTLARLGKHCRRVRPHQLRCLYTHHVHL